MLIILLFFLSFGAFCFSCDDGLICGGDGLFCGGDGLFCGGDWIVVDCGGGGGWWSFIEKLSIIAGSIIDSFVIGKETLEVGTKLFFFGDDDCELTDWGNNKFKIDFDDVGVADDYNI